MKDHDQAGLGWTVALRRQPGRIVQGRAEGGYTDAYELVCCECGDHPDLDYREVPPELQHIRGPNAFAAGIAAYEKHVSRYQAWWSLGLEATGPADRLYSALHSTAAQLFAQPRPGDVELDMSHCQSYAQWLSWHQEPWVTEAPTR
jgi:hypothetical protein